MTTETAVPTETAVSTATVPLTATVARLADEDATYWLLREGLGWSVVLQLVWQVPGTVDDAVLTRFATRLSEGRLHRRLRAPRVHGARPAWIPADGTPRAHLDTTPIDDTDIDSWAIDEMSQADLDAADGRCWRVRATPTLAGDTIVSLCALHLVTDGRGLVDAAAEALGSEPEHRRTRASDRRHPRRIDARDALGQVRAAGIGVARAVHTAVRGSGAEHAPDPREPRAPMAHRAPRARPVWATATVSAAEWDRIAHARGGTANTLFVAVVSGLLRSSGYAAQGVPVKVGVPVDRRRGADDERANATAGVSVMLTDDPVPGGDLTGLRASCKEAFVRLADGHRPAAIHLQPLIWLLPTRWVVAAATAGSGMPDAVTSNLGDVPDAAMVIGGRRARRLAFRGIADGVDPSGPHRFGDGVQSWLVRTGTDVTFSVVGFDEESFTDTDHLRRLLADELAAWHLPAQIW